MAAAACLGENRGGQDDKRVSFDDIHNCHPGICMPSDLFRGLPGSMAQPARCFGDSCAPNTAHTRGLMGPGHKARDDSGGEVHSNTYLLRRLFFEFSSLHLTSWPRRCAFAAIARVSLQCAASPRRATGPVLDPGHPRQTSTGSMMQ